MKSFQVEVTVIRNGSEVVLGMMLRMASIEEVRVHISGMKNITSFKVVGE